MRIIPPSYEILHTLDHQSLAVRIEYCGRICYKSEDRIDQNSAIPFVGKIAEHGHNSVLEMGGATLEITCRDSEAIQALFLSQPKYLHIDLLGENRLLLTGSIRAFRERLLFHPTCRISRALVFFLNQSEPWFFSTILPPDLDEDAVISIRQLDVKEVDTLPPDQLTRHRHLAAKFIVNRAVTHEIVRHRPCSFLQESQRYCRYSDDKFGNEVAFIRPLFFAENSPEYALWHKAMEEAEKIYLQLLATSSPQSARTVLPNSCKTELIVYANLAEWRHIFSLRTSKAAEPSMREVMIPLQAELQRIFPAIFA